MKIRKRSLYSFIAIFTLLLAVVVYAGSSTSHDAISNKNDTTVNGNVTINITVNESSAVILNITNFTHAGNTNISFNVTTNGTNLTTNNYTIITWRTSNGSYSDGIYNITVQIYPNRSRGGDIHWDLANRSDAKSTINITNITVDNTAPTVNMLSNSTNFTSQTDFPVKFNYTDLIINRTVKCLLYVNGSNLNNSAQTKLEINRFSNNTNAFLNISQNTTTTNLTNSTIKYDIKVGCTDGSGNQANSSTIQYVYDANAPAMYNASSTNVSTGVATLTWDTDEPGNATISYGLASATLNSRAGTATRYSRHQNVTLTGLTSGTKYYYSINACDVNNKCNTSGILSFTTTSASANPVDAVSSSTSGAVSASDVADEDTVVAEEEEPTTEEPTVRTEAVRLTSTDASSSLSGLSSGSSTVFTFDNRNEHTVTVDEITTTTVTVTIASEPVTVTLELGETVLVDMNQDGVDDLSVTLNSITDGQADLTIDRLAGAGDVDPEPEVPVAGLGSTVWWIVGGLAVLGGAWAFLRRRK